jgi:hypothetical protein
MPIRPLLLAALLLSSPLAALAASDPPPPAAAPPPADAPLPPPANGPVFPKLMTTKEADQTPEQKTAAAKQAQSNAVGERLLETARSLRNMGMLALSAIVGLIVSGAIGAMIALGVNAYRERRAAAAAKPQ